MKNIVELSAPAIKAAVKDSLLKPGLGSEPFMKLVAPILQQLNLEWRTVFGVAVSHDGVFSPREHTILFDLDTDKPVDDIVEILGDFPSRDTERESLAILGSRYFLSSQSAFSYCEWKNQ